MSHFDKAVIEVLKHEGGYVNHPSDPAGETNFGITKRNYHRLDIKALTREAAIDIYRADYWLMIYDALSYPIAAKVFDMAVNMGKVQAHKILQRAVGVFADGIIGPKTVAAANGLSDAGVLDAITIEQKKVYAAIVNHRPTSAVFMAGWNHRAEYRPVA